MRLLADSRTYIKHAKKKNFFKTQICDIVKRLTHNSKLNSTTVGGYKFHKFCFHSISLFAKCSKQK